MQIIGCIFLDSSFLDQKGQYFLTAQDFEPRDLHKIVYGTAANLYANGARRITIADVENHMRSNYGNSWATYLACGGAKWVQEAIDNATPANFQAYYDRLKKLTLLRNYTKAGIDVTWIYDPDNLIDAEKKKQQLDTLDATPLAKVAEKVEFKVTAVREDSVNVIDRSAIRAGDSIFALLDGLKERPEMGLPFNYGSEEDGYSTLLNRVGLGARLGKFYLRSAASGVGKSRSLAADACMLACKKIWQTNKWVPLVKNQDLDSCRRRGVLFISTELDIGEVQTLFLSFVSGVNEEKILTRNYTPEEEDRVYKAAEIIQEAPLYIELLPNFTVSDVENTIRRNHTMNGVNYFFYDYLGTSLGILEEVAGKAKGVSMREDSILFLLATRLKELAVEQNIFIESSTQLNAAAKTDPIPDQNLLRGAKSIADRIDLGTILLNTTSDDIDSLRRAGYIDQVFHGIEPNVKLSIYKNRRGKYVNCFVWMIADKGTCRFVPLGATTWNLEPYDIPPLKLEAYALESEVENGV